MARVLGIGGVFLRSVDPTALAAWYRDVLGIEFADGPFAILAGDDDSYAVLATFESDSDYIGDPARQQVMVNFRVDDLASMVEQLSAAGAHTEAIIDESNGRFTWTFDVDGNRIELWEPN